MRELRDRGRIATNPLRDYVLTVNGQRVGVNYGTNPTAAVRLTYTVSAPSATASDPSPEPPEGDE